MTFATAARTLTRRTALGFGTALAVLAGAVAFGQTAGAQQMVRDTSANSIISGGAVTPQEFIQKARANNPADLQTIYTQYGLTAAEYDRFLTDARMGEARKNGEIVVNGQVVAREARSLGREQKSYSSVRTIGGKNYHESRSQDVFIPESMPIMVLFDEQGRYEFGILTPCANPVRATPVTPLQRCDSLQRTPVADVPDTYDFTTRATAQNGARISHVIYDFGDGSTPEQRTNPAEAVRHAYTQPGTYQAKVTVYVQTAAGQIPVTSSSCQQAVTVRQRQVAQPVTPAYRCENLRASALADTSGRGFTFTANASHRNARVRHVDFDFGDGNRAQNVLPSSTTGTTTGTTTTGTAGGASNASTNTSVATNHTYAQPGSYTARATVYFTTTDANGTAVEHQEDCQVQVTVQQPVVQGASTERPQAPAILPETGVGTILVVFLAASLIGSAGYYLYTKRRLAGL
jgi:LPXTG-motif cell wall-anchored protein